MPTAAPVFRKANRKPFANKREVGRITGRKGQALRKRRLARSNYLCERCRDAGEVRSADVVDHIKPLALGGTDTDENTRNLCHDCHKAVTAEQFGRA